MAYWDDVAADVREYVELEAVAGVFVCVYILFSVVQYLVPRVVGFSGVVVVAGILNVFAIIHVVLIFLVSGQAASWVKWLVMVSCIFIAAVYAVSWGLAVFRLLRRWLASGSFWQAIGSYAFVEIPGRRYYMDYLPLVIVVVHVSASVAGRQEVRINGLPVEVVLTGAWDNGQIVGMIDVDYFEYKAGGITELKTAPGVSLQSYVRQLEPAGDFVFGPRKNKRF